MFDRFSKSIFILKSETFHDSYWLYRVLTNNFIAEFSRIFPLPNDKDFDYNIHFVEVSTFYTPSSDFSSKCFVHTNSITIIFIICMSK